MIGILPQQLYDMTLWEFSACFRAYNRQQLDKGKEQLAISWKTANLTGAAFAGKLRPLKSYLRDTEKVAAPKVDKDEFERRLRLAEEGGLSHGA